MINVKLTGSFRLYVIDRHTKKIIQDTGFQKNLIVETGKEFILDEIFDNGKWNSGIGIQSMAVGDSTDTNAGVLGPNAGRDVVIGGAWNGVSEDDWRLSSETARSIIISVARVDQSIVAIAQFLDGQFSEPSPIKIREVGIFLHETDQPVANPQDNPAEKPKAMVARRVYFGYDDEDAPTKYVDRPYYKVKDGNPLLMEYKLELL